MISAIEELQKEICKKYGAEFFISFKGLKVGIATNIFEGLVPINGFRHPPQGDTTGWYIYGGEGPISSDPDYFQPLHVHHLDEWCPQIKKYVGLHPGWRFLVDGIYEDVWFDENLLKI